MEQPTREVMKEEALKWMEILNISPEVITDFKNYDSVMACDGASGAFSPLTEGLKRLVEQTEHKYGCLVYLVVRMDTIYGHLDSLLFVTKYAEEWEMERDALERGYAMTYTHNVENPFCSEMGDIVVRTTKDGGLIRLG